MISIRRADERAMTNLGWLDSRHTFAFGRGLPSKGGPDPMGFRGLRVINDDLIEPGTGFGTHPHNNMEIISFIAEGSLAHKDSTGSQETIPAGGAQLTSAGSGVTHSEFNPSDSETTRLIQIWILPRERNTAPRYEQLDPDREAMHNRLRVIASPDGRDGSMTIGADATLFAARLDDGREVEVTIASGKAGFVQVISGRVEVLDEALGAGDGLAVEDADTMTIQAMDGEAEVLVFELP